MKAIVIGSGLSGLTAASALVQAGWEVDVFEQASQIGGVTAGYQKGGFQWDLGQLLLEGFGPDEPVGKVLSELGVIDSIQVLVDDRGYVFPDFALRKPEAYQGIRWRLERLKELFPEESAGLERYWKDYLRFTRLMTLARRMEDKRGLNALAAKVNLYATMLPFLPKKDWSAARLMADYFHSEKLKLVFTSILADFFTAPSQFIGLGVFALNPEASFEKRMPKELAKGAEQLYHYSIRGGIRALVEALGQRIEALGGKIFTSRPVRKIQVANGRAVGVVDDHNIESSADVVIASGGAKETFLGLVGEASLPAGFCEQVQNIPLMDSVFMVHLGVDFDPSPYVHGTCTYYYNTYDIEGTIAEARQGIYHEGRAGFVVHVPSLHSPEVAPPGYHAMTIYTICPDTLREGNWNERKEDYADQLVACAEKYIPGLSQHIQVAEILTPDDFRIRTHTTHHAFGGIAPVLGSWRVPHQTPLPGLWFIGAQSESGGGVNNVIPAAYKTARRICDWPKVA